MKPILATTFWFIIKNITFGEPVEYNIHIEWYSESYYRVVNGKEISKGWPLTARE